MLVSLTQALSDAVRDGYAVGSFNATGLETLRAVVGAAEQARRSVILNFAEVHSPYVTMEEIAPVMLDYARRAAVPVCVHLDHGSGLAACVRAIRLGFTSVMLDASALPYEENLAETAEVVRIAHAAGVSVEAELGSIGPDSDAYTDPDAAAQFASETGVDALAIAFGTSHGVYSSKPVLDLDRVARIRGKTSVPLVMHGGSGLSREEFQTAIRNGIRKINYYTYMSLAGGSAVRELIGQSGERVFFHDLALRAQEAMQRDVCQAIATFSLED